MLLRTFPTPLLIVIAPALFLTELALLPISFANGWLRMKLLSYFDIVRALPRVLRERKQIQETRKVSSLAFAKALTAELDSPNFGTVGRNPLIARGLGIYWKLAKLTLSLVPDRPR
jgi:hypothetical protein